MNGSKGVTATFMLTLTVTKPGNGNGTVTSTDGHINCGSTCTYYYTYGTQVQLSETPSSDSIWGTWGGACSGTGTTCTVIMNADRQVTATFTIDPLVTVATSGAGAGTVTSGPAGISCGHGGACSGYFLMNSQLSLSAIPDQNSYFVNWTNCPATPNNTLCQFTVTGNAGPITAAFNTSPSLQVTEQGTGTGTVTSSPPGINCSNGGGLCTAYFIPGAQVTLTAARAGSSYFAGWGGACSGTGTCVVTLNSGVTSVTATFNRDPLLTAAKWGTGTGTVASGDGGINCGSTCTRYYDPNTAVTLMATPGQFSYFSNWSGAGCGTGQCAFAMPSSDTVVTAFFYVDPQLTVTKQGGGTGTVASTDQNINCGPICSYYYDPSAQITLIATPGQNSYFSGWTGAGCSTGQCSFTMGTANVGVAASFIVDPQVTVTKQGNGTGTVTSTDGDINCGPTCSYSYAPGAVINLTATPGQNSYFSGWSGAGCSGTGQCTVTMGITNTGVTATFTRDPLLTVSKIGDGTGTVTSTDGDINCGATCNYSYTPNTVVTLNASPNSGYFFTGWSACSGTGSCAITVTSDTTVTASFDSCSDQLYKVGNNYYPTLQQAYNYAVTLTGDITIQARAVTSTDDALNAGTNKVVTLEGGHDCSFSQNIVGMTTLVGSAPVIQVTSGTLNLKYVTIVNQ